MQIVRGLVSPALRATSAPLAPRWARCKPAHLGPLGPPLGCSLRSAVGSAAQGTGAGQAPPAPRRMSALLGGMARYLGLGRSSAQGSVPLGLIALPGRSPRCSAPRVSLAVRPPSVTQHAVGPAHQGFTAPRGPPMPPVQSAPLGALGAAAGSPPLPVMVHAVWGTTAPQHQRALMPMPALVGRLGPRRG